MMSFAQAQGHSKTSVHNGVISATLTGLLPSARVIIRVTCSELVLNNHSVLHKPDDDFVRMDSDGEPRMLFL